jgi:hypothetical protein
MLGWRRQRRVRRGGHVVEYGHVWCPVRHADVGIDRCLMCPSFRDLADEDGATYLYCRPRASAGSGGPFHRPDMYRPFI